MATDARARRGTKPVEPLTLKGKAEPVPAYRLCRWTNAPRLVDGAVRRTRRASSDGCSPSSRTPSTRTPRDCHDHRLAGPRQDASRARADVGARRTTRVFARRGATLPDVDVRADRRCAARRGAGSRTPRHRGRGARCAPRARSPPTIRTASGSPRARRAILGVGAPGTTEETFWALRRLIETAARVAAGRPRLIDDLHWAEPLLLDLDRAPRGVDHGRTRAARRHRAAGASRPTAVARRRRPCRGRDRARRSRRARRRRGSR